MRFAAWPFGDQVPGPVGGATRWLRQLVFLPELGRERFRA
jgi:hypothetical protein